MANASSVRVRVKNLVKKFNDNGKNEILEVDFDSELMSNFSKAMCDLSYECEGIDCGDGQFDVFGRWHYEGNFNWEAETEALYNALEELGCEGFEATFVDWECGMSEVIFGDLVVRDRAVNFTETEFYSYKEFANKVGVPCIDPSELTTENIDEYHEQNFILEDAMLDYYDEWSENH